MNIKSILEKFQRKPPTTNKGKKYRLKASKWFYEGTPPTINETNRHTPNIIVTPVMILMETGRNSEYIEFEIKVNWSHSLAECLRSGCKVYYKTELFEKLNKIELKEWNY